MNKKQKKNLIRIIISAVLLIAFHFIPKAVLPEKSIVRFIIYLIAYLVVGYDVLIKAFKGIKNKQAFDEYLLMAIATIGAMALGLFRTGDYVEAVAVMLFYQIGEWFQSYAVGKSRRNISDLMDIRPDYANIENEDGSLEQVDPDEVEVGSIIVVQPGEKIPIDGIIVDGNATLNTAALTGESKPRDVEKGDSVISGCINTNGLLKIETTTDFDESTTSKILDLVENASSRKSKSEAFISRFARIYTPVVVYLAIALAGQEKKVALVEGNLRNPSILSILGMPQMEKGLSDLLSGGCKAQDVMIPYTKHNNLTLLPGGKLSANPATLWSSPAAVKLFKELEADFDYVLIDSPASASISDSGLLARLADGYVYVVRKGYAQLPILRKGMGTLSNFGCKAIGSVLNAD